MSIKFSNHLDGEERDGCFNFTLFLMHCDSQCSVTLPHAAVGWSAVCYCGISVIYVNILSYVL